MKNGFFDPKMWLYDFVKWTGAIPALIDLRPKKIYKTSKKSSDLKRGSYVISCNHMSYIDPIIVTAGFWFRRIYFVATKDFFRKKLLAFLFTRLNCIPIDKENTGIKTFLTVKEKLDEGRPVCVFPEGSVSENGLCKYKSGVVMMACVADKEILPVYVGKRKKVFINRQRIIIGDRLNVRDFMSGKFPTMEEIEKITDTLNRKEKELEMIFMEDGK